MTRVIAGTARGRRLQVPPGPGTRPTSDRAREGLFSSLQSLTDVEGAAVLDLFCGTGALGIEALSRGASWASFVDLDTRPVERNIAALGIGERAAIVRTDAVRFVARDRGRYDLVLCDPPYRLARRLGPELDRLLAPRLSQGARVITEAAADAPLELSLPLILERRYVPTLLRIHAIAGDL